MRAVIAGAEGWDDIEEFGRQLPHVIPSHDTISRVFRLLKPEAFQQGVGR